MPGQETATWWCVPPKPNPNAKPKFTEAPFGPRDPDAVPTPYYYETLAEIKATDSYKEELRILKEQRRHSRTRTHSRATQCLANDGKTPIMNLLLGGETNL